MVLTKGLRHVKNRRLFIAQGKIHVGASSSGLN
jgi:hypothetical protein